MTHWPSFHSKVDWSECAVLIWSLSLFAVSGYIWFAAHHVGLYHRLHGNGCYGDFSYRDKSMKYLKKGCKKLQTLIMLYCSHISKWVYFYLLECLTIIAYQHQHYVNVTSTYYMLFHILPGMLFIKCRSAVLKSDTVLTKFHFIIITDAKYLYFEWIRTLFWLNAAKRFT